MSDLTVEITANIAWLPAGKLNIDTLPAGKLCDALVATQIMGFKQLPVNFAPSTDPVMALQVAEQAGVHTIRRVASEEPDHASQWEAIVYLDAGHGIADTFELAICRCALNSKRLELQNTARTTSAST